MTKYCCPLPVTFTVVETMFLPSGLVIARFLISNSFISMALCVGML